MVSAVRATTHSFDPDLQAALARPGPASLIQVTELQQWFLLNGELLLLHHQYSSHHFLYLLGPRSHYLGQGQTVRPTGGAPGYFARFREHVKAFYQVRLGSRKTANRRRYESLLHGNPKFLGFCAFIHRYSWK